MLCLVVDPFYCGLIDPCFAFLVADMHMYFWSAPEQCVLAVGEQLRRFMKQGLWAVEARSRLIDFLIEVCLFLFVCFSRPHLFIHFFVASLCVGCK
jgi:hypothetical protein